MIGLKKLTRSAGIVGAVGAGSLGMILGIGAGTANAAPPSPAGPVMDWAQDRGHGWHGDRGWRDDDRGWRSDGRRSGLHINLPCVTGPHGFVTWCP